MCIIDGTICVIFHPHTHQPPLYAACVGSKGTDYSDVATTASDQPVMYFINGARLFVAIVLYEILFISGYCVRGVPSTSIRGFPLLLLLSEDMDDTA